jgi:subtilisin-like proprotein convertase family protein
MNCSHTKTKQTWVTTDYWGEETEGNWEFETVSTTVDLDLHRYKCTQCGEVMYYSGAAKEYYETGVDRKGLFL